MTTKTCSKCRECKPLEDFGTHPKTVDGRQSWCIACTLKHKRQRYRDDPGHRSAVLERNRARRKWLAIDREAAAQP